MTLPQWSLVIDSNDDVSFAESSMVVNVLALRASLGLRGWDDRVAAPASLSITVDDRARLFSPEAAGAGSAYPGRWLRLQATYNSVTYTLWTGVIDWIAASEAPYTARIEARGRWQWADAAVDVPLWLSATASEVVDYVLDAGRFRQALRPVGSSEPYWVLGRVGSSELGGMRVAPAGEQFKVTAGVSDELTYYGGGVVAASVRSVVQDVTAATWARFFEDEQGRFVLRARSAGLTTTDPDYSFIQDDLAGLDYRFGDVLYNRVETRQAAFLRVQNQLVWQNVAVQRFRRGVTRRRLVLTASDGDLVQIVEIVSSSIEFRDSETGGFVASPTWRIETLSNGLILEVDNQTAGLLYIQIGAAQIYADVVIQDAAAIELYQDLGSVMDYGTRQYVLQAPAFADPDTVRSLAHMLLHEMAAPTGRVHSIMLESWLPAQLVPQLAIHVDDVIELDLEGLGHSRRYLVRGLEHRCDGLKLETQFWLAPQGIYWVLGVSRLGVDTYPGY